MIDNVSWIYFIVVIDLVVCLVDDVQVGVFILIGFDVEIGVGIVVGFYCSIYGLIWIGCDNCFVGYVVIGGELQDKKFVGECIELVIGDCNVFCEFVMFNRGIGGGGGIIIIGNDNWMLVYMYVVYDCYVGNFCVFFNNIILVGYVIVGDYVIISGFVGVYQFCCIGVYVFFGMGVLINGDVLLFIMVGIDLLGCLCGINSEGLKCRGFDVECILVIKCVYCMLYVVGLLLVEVKVQLIEQVCDSDDVKVMLDFIEYVERFLL